jgi:protoporphyrinogen oxidase
MREKLGYLEGGSKTLLQAMLADIKKHGGDVQLQTPVIQVIIKNGGVRAIQTSTGFEQFDIVVSTIPLPYIPKVIPNLPSEVLAQFKAIKNIAVVCVIVKLCRPLTDNFWLNTNDPEMDIPGIVEYSNLRPLEHSILYVPFYMPSEHVKYSEPDEVFVEKVRRYFKKINPSLKDEDFMDIRASRYLFAQPIGIPGYLKTIPAAKLPVTGLWVADTSHYYPEDRGISESIELGRMLARDAVQ